MTRRLGFVEIYKNGVNQGTKLYSPEGTESVTTYSGVTVQNGDTIRFRGGVGGRNASRFDTPVSQEVYLAVNVYASPGGLLDTFGVNGSYTDQWNSGGGGGRRLSTRRLAKRPGRPSLSVRRASASALPLDRQGTPLDALPSPVRAMASQRLLRPLWRPPARLSAKRRQPSTRRLVKRLEPSVRRAKASARMLASSVRVKVIPSSFRSSAKASARWTDPLARLWPSS